MKNSFDIFFRQSKQSFATTFSLFFSDCCHQAAGEGDSKGCSLLQISCSLETDLDEVLMPVSVISTGHLTRPEVRIGHVTISRNSSWIHLDNCLRGLVKTYLACLDPEHSLELSSQSMVCYQCGNIRRVFKGPEPERRPTLLPDTTIWISFRGGTDRGSLEDLCFTSLLPRSSLKQYVSAISKFQRAVIVGPPKAGKTLLASSLAEYLVLASGQELTPHSVHLFLTNKATAESEQWSELVTRARPPPTVIILDNIQDIGACIIQMLAKLGPALEETPFIICTSSPSQHVQHLTEKFNFSEVTVGNDVDILQGLLGRFLRRKMLNIEVTTRLANLDMPEAIQWLLRIYCNLYIFVKTTSQTKSFLSPSIFMSCPVESTQQLKTWFIEHLWNSSLVTKLRQVVAESDQMSVDFEDPVKFVIRTWPWRSEVESLPQVLEAVSLTETQQNVSEDPLVNYSLTGLLVVKR